LSGLIVGGNGHHRLSPTHAVKKDKRYRYYVSAALITGRRSQSISTASWSVMACQRPTKRSQYSASISKRGSGAGRLRPPEAQPRCTERLN
jgi:hypothetical protein